MTKILSSNELQPKTNWEEINRIARRTNLLEDLYRIVTEGTSEHLELLQLDDARKDSAQRT